MLIRLIPFIALNVIPGAAAAHPMEGKYACLNEIAVGIEQNADGSIVQGKFEYRPEKFILSVEMGLLNGLEASVNPAVGHRYFQEKDVYLPIDDHVSLTATGGHGWAEFCVPHRARPVNLPSDWDTSMAAPNSY